VSTAGAVIALAQKYNVKLPVLTAVARIIDNELTPKRAVMELMNLPQVGHSVFCLIQFFQRSVLFSKPVLPTKCAIFKTSLEVLCKLVLMICCFYIEINFPDLVSFISHGDDWHFVNKIKKVYSIFFQLWVSMCRFFITMGH
jgi:hypothetical protein